MYKGIYFLITLFLCYSCGIVQINNNNYNNLTENDKIKIKPFTESLSYDKTSTPFVLFEINTTDIQKQIKNNNFTWVHLWAPYCKDDECKRLHYYSELEQKYLNTNLKIYIISIYYNVALINEIAMNNDYTGQIYVLQNSYFGQNMSKAQKKLHQELTKTNENKWFSEYLFKDSVLVYKGFDIDINLLDSLIIPFRKTNF